MSMQISVLSDRQLNSVAEWQQAIDAESFPLRMSYDRPLVQLGGFMPAYLGKRRTGFDCRQRSARDITVVYPKINFGHAWKYGMAFIWGADIDELQAVWMAAAAYARATEGVVFDEQEGKVLGPEEAIQVVRDIEQNMPNVEVVLRNLMEQVRTKPGEYSGRARSRYFHRRLDPRRADRRPAGQDAGSDQTVPGLLGYGVCRRSRQIRAPAIPPPRWCRQKSRRTRTISTSGSRASFATPFKHDPEKWRPVFR
jgi:hypothetical protein